MFLTPAQLAALTDRQTKPAQCRRLRAMKIPYIYEPPGEIKVLVTAIERRSYTESRRGYAAEPDFSHFPKVA